MTTYQNNGSSNGAQDPGIGQRVDQIGADAQQLWDNARGAVTDLRDTMDLRGRVERNPYLMVAAALGVGYVLGGGLFTRTTGRLLRLGMRLAALPLVKDELIGMAEAAVRGIEVGAGRVAERQGTASPGMQEPSSGRQA
jgi:hypothetical protein